MIILAANCYFQVQVQMASLPLRVSAGEPNRKGVHAAAVLRAVDSGEFSESDTESPTRKPLLGSAFHSARML